MIQSRDARSAEVLSDVAEETNTEEVEAACQKAQIAFAELEASGRRGRAEMLNAMAGSLEAHEEEVVAVADQESALGVARLTGELKRTCFQLRFFAEVLTDGAYLEVVIDHAGATAMGNERKFLRSSTICSYRVAHSPQAARCRITLLRSGCANRLSR